MSIKSTLRKSLKKGSFTKSIWRALHLANVTWLKLRYSDEAYFKKVYKKSNGEEIQGKKQAGR